MKQHKNHGSQIRGSGGRCYCKIKSGSHMVNWRKMLLGYRAERIICTLTLTFCLLSCRDSIDLDVFNASTFNQQLISNGQGRKEGGLKTGRWIYSNPNSIDTIDWCISINDVDSISNSIMCDWRVKNCLGCLFWAQSSDEKESIVVIDSINSGGLKALDNYTLTAMEYVTKNTVEGINFTSGNWWKVHDVDGTHSYFSICSSVINDEAYLYYIFYFYKNGHIYDFTYRYGKLNSRSNHNILFWDFIYNFKYKGDFVVEKDVFKIRRLEEVFPR